jgi:hypothetical protein
LSKTQDWRYSQTLKYVSFDKEKTFFPKDWNCQKVIEKIIEALETVDFSELPISNQRIVIQPLTKEGIKLKIAIRTDESKILSVYPIFPDPISLEKKVFSRGKK